MLQAMNSGHEGSLTTAHANSPRDLLSRLEVMTLMAGMDLPLAAIRAQLAGAVDLIVHQARLAGGARRISSIVEVVGLDSGVVQTQELFRLAPEGHHEACGQVPAFYEQLRAAGAGHRYPAVPWPSAIQRCAMLLALSASSCGHGRSARASRGGACAARLGAAACTDRGARRSNSSCPNPSCSWTRAGTRSDSWRRCSSWLCWSPSCPAAACLAARRAQRPCWFPRPWRADCASVVGRGCCTSCPIALICWRLRSGRAWDCCRPCSTWSHTNSLRLHRNSAS